MNEHWLLNGVSILLVGLVFWVVRAMINKAEKKIEDIKKKVEDPFTERMHKMICLAAGAEMKLHISEVAEKNRNLIVEKNEKNKEAIVEGIEDNKVYVGELIKELKEDIRKNLTRK